MQILSANLILCSVSPRLKLNRIKEIRNMVCDLTDNINKSLVGYSQRHSCEWKIHNQIETIRPVTHGYNIPFIRGLSKDNWDWDYIKLTDMMHIVHSTIIRIHKCPPKKKKKLFTNKKKGYIITMYTGHASRGAIPSVSWCSWRHKS